MRGLFRERDFRLLFVGQGVVVLLCPLWLRMSPVRRVRTIGELTDVPDRVLP